MKLKRKGLLITLITLICVLTFSAISILIFAIYTECNKTPKNVNAADLTIYNLSQLQSFASDVTNGNTYEGKTVVLANNIDCGGASVGIGGGTGGSLSSGGITASNTGHPFAGTFDGNGYTISNVTYTSNYTAESSMVAGFIVITYRNYYYSLFNCLSASAVIINLKVKNCGRTDFSGYPSRDNKDKHIAGLVGVAGDATISNCMVENLTVFTKDTATTIHVSGIAAVGGKIYNCHVKNFIVDNCGDLCGMTLNGSVSNSILQSMSYTSASSVKDFSSGTVSNCYKTGNTVSGLNTSATGGTSGSIWYYASEYNGGYPYLRSVIKNWTTINFKSSNTDYGSVSKSSIQVPSDAESAKFDDYNDSTTASIAPFSQSIRAIAGSKGVFKKWTYTSFTKTYTANFDIKRFEVEFFDDDEDAYNNGDLAKLQYRLTGGSWITSTDVSFKIASGAKISLKFLYSHAQCSYTSSKNKCYVVVEFTFNGKLVTNGVEESSERNYQVIYVLTSSEYYIESAGVDAHTTNQEITISGAEMFYIDFQPRDYDLEII